MSRKRSPRHALVRSAVGLALAGGVPAALAQSSGSSGGGIETVVVTAQKKTRKHPDRADRDHGALAASS